MADKCKPEIQEKEIECVTPPNSCDALPMPVPDWRKTETPFKNEKEGVYSVKIELESEVKSISEISDPEVLKTSALDEMLIFYGKSAEKIPISYEDLEIKELYIDPEISDFAQSFG